MTVEEELFLQQILENRDQLYQETSRLKSQLSGYQNFESERASYQKQLTEKDQAIIKLKQQIEMLQRKIWGKSSEKYIPEDPQQRKLDFEGLDLLPEEKELATCATQEIEPVSYTHLRAHETVLDLVCRLLLEKKKTTST